MVAYSRRPGDKQQLYYDAESERGVELKSDLKDTQSARFGKV